MFPLSWAQAPSEAARMKITVRFMGDALLFDLENKISQKSLQQAKALNRSVGCDAQVRPENRPFGGGSGRKHGFGWNGDLDIGIGEGPTCIYISFSYMLVPRMNCFRLGCARGGRGSHDKRGSWVGRLRNDW